jgi:monothiol glutaredoxin
MEAQMSDVQTRIDELVKTNKVVLFMKGNPQMPQCGFSAQAATILTHLGVSEFAHFDVLSDPEIRQGIKEYSNWPTIPQLYINGEFLGGSDIMMEQYQTGELAAQLQA